MSFINFNNKTETQSKTYTKTMVLSALLASETKNTSKARTMVSGLNEQVTLNEALALFSNKLNAMTALNVAAIEYKPLLEGQFSWMTHDRGEQIGSERENTIDVWMFDNEGNMWYEKGYEGYGVFGNMDYYELVAKMNGYSEEDLDIKVGKRNKIYREMREIGIALAFDELETRDQKGKVLFPALMSDPKGFNYKRHDFTKEAQSDPNQSWYQEPEYEEDEYDDDDEYYESTTNEGVGTIALGIMLAWVGLKVIKAVAKTIIGKIGANVELPAEKLKQITDEMVTRVAKETNSGKMLLASTFLKIDMDKKIDSGEIKTISALEKAMEEYLNTNESAVNEGAISDIHIMAQEAKDFKSFVKAFKKEHHDLSGAGEPGQFEAWLQTIYDDAKESMDESVTNEAKLKAAGLSKDETKKVAETLAAAMSKAEGSKVTVNLKTLEEDSFDLDVDGEEFDGGSYNIYDNGSVVNHAVTPNEIYGNIDSSVDDFIKGLKKPLKESVVNEMIGTFALGVMLAWAGIKVLKAVAKKVVGSIGMNVELSADELKNLTAEMVNKVAEETGSASAILNTTMLKTDIDKKIDSGEIKNIAGVNKELERYLKANESYTDDVNEGRSINKIQKEWSEVTTKMKAGVEEWKKAPEGELKTSLFDNLKSLTLRKKELEAELDDAVQLKDVDAELAGESFVYEAEIKSDDEFRDYAFDVLKKAFGADFDEAKATKTVDGILSKSKSDYGKAIGMLTAGLGESLAIKPTKAERWMNLLEKVNKSVNEDLRADLKKYIKSNSNELNAYADDDNWEAIHNMLRTDFDVKEGSKEEDTLFTTFNFVF